MILRFKSVVLFLLWLGVLTLSGCAPMLKPGPTRFDPGLAVVADDLDSESLRAAIRQSKAYLTRLPPETIVGVEPRLLAAGEVLDALTVFELLLDDWFCAPCVARALEERFEFLPSSADEALAEVLFTGYYQPVMDGSLVQSDEYRYPLYARPPDLLTAEQVAVAPSPSVKKVFGRADGEEFLPSYTRREIDEFGALEGRGLEIAWVKDPVDVFFLHIQGSGIVRLAEGGQLSVGYAGQNGRPYRSIGRLLIDQGKIDPEDMSMQRLRRYLAENFQEQNEIFAYNESYVFFRVLEGGPLGSLEVPVTPGRTIATDSRLFPKGALAVIQTEIPIIDGAGQLAGWRPITRFVLNQDTGGAIRGYRRADLYFGSGDEAGGMAGYMNRPGGMFFLVLKGGGERMKEFEKGERMKDGG
jgi:membrane-bound lytic murein transglycosylase A